MIGIGSTKWVIIIVLILFPYIIPLVLWIRNLRIKSALDKIVNTHELVRRVRILRGKSWPSDIDKKLTKTRQVELALDKAMHRLFVLLPIVFISVYVSLFKELIGIKQFGRFPQMETLTLFTISLWTSVVSAIILLKRLNKMLQAKMEELL